MKIKRDLLVVLVLVGLQIPILGMAGSFSTSFNNYSVELNGVSILSCPSPDWRPGQPCSQVSIIKWDLGQKWPDNGLQRKLKLDLSNRQSSGVKKTRDMTLTGYQKACVQFYAPKGISDHMDLGVLGDNISAVQVTGYFAVVGRNHNRLGPGYRLAIEKATPKANWLFPGTYPYGGVPFTFNPNRMYKLVIVASFDATTVHVDTIVDEWVPGRGWNKTASIKHTDNNITCETDTTSHPEGYCPIVAGKNAFFGAIFQNDPIYFDQFFVEW
jgi:hypothetical protein